MNQPIRVDVVVWVGDHATTRGTLGQHAAAVLAYRREGTDPDRWHAVDERVAAGLRTLTVDPAVTVADLARTALDESGEDSGEVWQLWLEDAVSGDRLPDEASVGEHLDDGDLVLLKAETPPMGAYELAPLGDPEQLFDRLHVAAALEVAAWPRLWGALLYTEEDAALATYVRTHFDELNALSGDLLRIFVVERPASWRQASKYWRAHLEPPLLRTLSVLRWLKWTPYDKSGLYDVARELGVDPARFPCLVLFGGTGNGTIVFPIESASPASFRELFTEIHRAVRDTPSGYDLRAAYEDSAERARSGSSVRGAEALRALAASASWADRDALARVEAAKTVLRRTTFSGPTVVLAQGTLGEVNFHGPTTFINKPVNTVIRDFQNTHAGEYGAQLTELLSLALNSADLTPEDRLELARRVTRVAETLKPGETGLLVGYVLGDLQYFAVRGADIYERVREIVTELRGSLELR